MKLSILVSALLVAVFWGTYGPALANARTALGSPFKPYVMIGAAYLVWGILGGLLGMLVKGDNFSFTGAGSVWGFTAGSLGALGALALTWAMFEGGSRMPHVVMSIVFGGAVTVSALVSVWRTWDEGYGSPWLWAGILGVALSNVLIAYNTPQEHAPRPSVTSDGSLTSSGSAPR